VLIGVLGASTKTVQNITLVRLKSWL